jgi:hypothetical protein
LIENEQIIEQAQNIKDQFNEASDTVDRKIKRADDMTGYSHPAASQEEGSKRRAAAQIAAQEAEDQYREKVKTLATEAESVQLQIHTILADPQFDSDFLTWRREFDSALKGQVGAFDPHKAGDYLVNYATKLPH